MGYLLPTEYVEYGLSPETADDLVVTASVLMEAYCRRPSLLVTQYVERIRLTSGSQTARLSYRPLAAAEGADSPLVQVKVRFGKPRRGETADLFREQVAFVFGVPGSWSDLDPASLDINLAAGEVTFPENFLGLNYNEVEVTYTSGLTIIPPAVKVACAQVVKNAQAMPAMNVRSSRIDTMQMEYFAGSLVDVQVQTLLRPYVAERLG
ncbi:hypothetical protein [Edaphobacter modestus]|uniref:PhiE125 gp8 family phage protein n=1 Tax=Edaphobacter modestus TaxID=388466 RepID=A0A4Q7YVZ2_9BACT|nr:hypothetical protein [Edaphobacter modestus]RZU41828.1 hypothetical protein BDD14_3365 [Edaphobacter modestus]